MKIKVLAREPSIAHPPRGAQNTCATCRHWRHIRDDDYENWPGPHGECRLFDEDSQERMAWVTGVTGEDLCLVTRPEFGCGEWVDADLF